LKRSSLFLEIIFVILGFIILLDPKLFLWSLFK